MLFFFLSKFGDINLKLQITFSLLIFFSIFGFTSLMDFYSWAPVLEIFRGVFSIIFVIFTQIQFLESTSPLILNSLIGYFIFTFLVGIWARIKELNRKLVLQ
jgi:hypothetical protein